MLSLRKVLLVAIWSLSTVRLGLAQEQQAVCKSQPANVRTCSPDGMNSSCEVWIDRLRPVAPRTITVRRGSVITVHVLNPSPFETIALDLKSASDAAAPDLYSAAFSAQSGNAAKMQVVAYEVAHYLAPLSPAQQEFQIKRAQLRDYAQQQRILLSEADPSIPFKEIQSVLQAPPAGICDNNAWDKYGYPIAWLAPVKWHSFLDSMLLRLETPANLNRTTLQASINQLDADSNNLLQYQPAAGVGTPDEVKNWNAAQAAVTARKILLDKAIASTPNFTLPVVANIEALRIGFNSLSLDGYDSSDQLATAIDLKPNDHDVTSETWSLDYINIGTTTVKNALTVPTGGGTPTSSLSASDIVTSASPSTSVTMLALAYQRAQRLEFATGVMVPFRPYHSYSTAEAATGGVVTGNVVQESLTYTAVPLALVNIVLKQGLAKGRPVAGFTTIGTGVNAASGSVEFGLGGSFSWRSFMISFLADIGRDTELIGGFYPNEPLPASNPPKPLTNTYWSVRPAIALSVRIPLGGSGSSH